MKTQIRVWTLGDLDTGLIPGKGAIDKVRALLSNLKPGEVNDIVWGPDLKCTVIETDTDNVKDEVKSDTETALIFGVGQDGVYLTQYLHSKGYKVVGVNRRSSQPRRYLDELVKEGLELVEGDCTDAHSVNSIISKYKPGMLFFLSAQSHVHTSFNSPASTFEINTIGLINVLESVRTISPKTRVYNAATSELFGSNYSMTTEYDETIHFNIKEIKPSEIHQVSDERFESGPFQNECTPMDNLQSPYAISKLAAFNLVKLYRESYGLFCCSGILFNHESPHRGENFVTRKITRYVGKLKVALDKAIEDDNYDNDIPSGFIKSYPKLQLGNLEAKRDWSHSSDVVRAMVLMLQNEEPKDYVVGSGETHSIKEFLDKAFSYVDLNWKDWVEVNQDFIRPAEVDLLCSKPDLVKEELGWKPLISFDGLVKCMVNHDIELAKKESVFQ